MKKTNILLTASALAFSLIVIPLSASAATLYRQLELGSTGVDVSTLQNFLATNPLVYPAGLVTGYFGPLTKSAVIRFQALNGISQVGRVGPQTLAVINSQIDGGFTTNSPFVEAAPGFTSKPTISLNGSVATFNINTTVGTRASVYYSTSPIVASENFSVNPIAVTVSGTGVISNTNLQYSHNVNTEALASNTVYYSMVVVADTNGIVSVIRPAAFRTN